MNILLLVFSGISVLLLIGGAIFFYFRMKGAKKYPFKLYSKDFSSSRTIYGQMRRKLENKLKKLFYLKDYDHELELADPTFFENGVGFREIIINSKGEPQYVSRRVSKDGDLEFSLNSEEKTLALYRYQEAQNRYPEQMNKWQSISMILLMVLMMITLIGNIYMGVQLTAKMNQAVEVAKENGDVTNGLNNVANTMVKLQEGEARLVSTLNSIYSDCVPMVTS